MLIETAQSSTPASARDRILTTAHGLFYRDGIRATGIDRVIAEAHVTKVTFYRHFPSKNDLILAYLDYRHGLWMAWFTEALERHVVSYGSDVAQAVVSSMSEWFHSEHYRGCAFINAAAELDAGVPGVLEATRNHKYDMAHAIARLLPPTLERDEIASAISMAVDGAIIRAQYTGSAADALALLQRLLQPFR